MNIRYDLRAGHSHPPRAAAAFSIRFFLSGLYVPFSLATASLSVLAYDSFCMHEVHRGEVPRLWVWVCLYAVHARESVHAW